MIYEDILNLMIEKNVTDMFVRVNSILKGKINVEVEALNDVRFTLPEVEQIIDKITGEKEKKNLKEKKSCEFAMWHKEFWRFRISIFYQRDSAVVVIRRIDLRIPKLSQIGLPADVLEKFSKERRGMVLLTGITGSGKSTTIASMMEYINENFGRHILTVEEPVEFTFTDKKSIINQREIGRDVISYTEALRQFALHSPDVIYIGNIRDQDTCHAALTAAETGVLVFSTMHTVNATSTVERMINFFPPHQHNLILNQLSFLLKGVISQRLIPLADGKGLIPAYEIMVLSPSISRLIRENKMWEIPRYITAGDVYGMKSFHQCLMELITTRQITPQVGLEYADKKEELEMELRNRGLL